jgi:HK97 gp10 family phage protein
MGFTIALQRTAAYTAKIEAIRAALGGGLINPVLLAAAMPVVNAAKQKAPYLTGTLRRSIRAEVQNGAVVVGSDAPYAARLEFGFEGADSRGRVYHQAPRPYLRPAIFENVEAVKAATVAALRAMLRAL